MKSILVATDFSPQSQHTLRFVLDLLKDTRESSRVLLINTYLINLNNASHELVQNNDELKSLSKKLLEDQKREALEWVRNPNIVIETSSHMGSLTNVVLNLVKKEKIDLVAIGKDGGSHIEQIVSQLKTYNCPLLITNDREQNKSL